MSNFITVTKEEFESYLFDGFKQLDLQYSKEYIYQMESEKKGVAIRVYSSVDVRTGKTRSYGTDAVRVVFWDTLNDRPIGKGKRINRVEKTTSIGDRIRARISVFINSAKDQKVRRIDGDYIKTILQHPVVRNNYFAQNLLEKLNQYGKLTDGQIDCIVGEKSSKGNLTFEAQIKLKDPSFGGATIKVGDDTEVEEKPSTEITRQDRQERQEDIFTDDITDLYEQQTERRYSVTENVDPKGSKLTKSYKRYKYKFETFNPVQTAVIPHIREDKNMVIGAETSGGKTVCAELIMDYVLKKRKEIVIYLSPLKSLTQEKYDDWQKRFSKETITILTGDYTLSDKMKNRLKKSTIVVMTSEMCDSRTRKMKSEKNYWLNKVGLVVVDEAHILTTDRGHAVETGLMRFATINPNARIMLLSATMPNVSELGDWLTSLNGKESTILFSKWRPVELQIKYCEYRSATNGYGREDYWGTQANKMAMALEPILSKPDEKFLVFCHDKGTGRKIVSQLAKLGVDSTFHNADLDLNERLGIEKSFENKKGGLRVLVSTSTLAWGRNLPARNVVVVGVHRGLNEVDQLDIIQMAGRAGRYGIDDAGFVYLVIPEGSKRTWENVFQNPRPVNSVLNNRNILAFHVLAEVQNKVVRNIGTLVEWYERSLSALQSLKKFDHVNARALIEELVRMEMLTTDGQSVSITDLGRVSAWLYFSPYDVYAWYKNFCRLFGEKTVVQEVVDVEFKGDALATAIASGIKPTVEVTDETISWAISEIPSNDLGYVRKDLQDLCEGWRRMLVGKGINPNINTIPNVIGAHNSMNGKSDKQTDMYKREAVYDIRRRCQAFGLIDSMYAKWDKKDFWKVLSLRVMYGVPSELTDLVRIEGVGAKRAVILWNDGFNSIEDVANIKKRKKLGKLFKSVIAKKMHLSAKKLLKETEE